MIRRVKQYSDRGKIKDIKANQFTEVAVIELTPTPFELRARKMFDYAQKNNDTQLQEATGFITTDYVSDKNAIPLTVYRIRKIVDDIKSKSPGRIEQLSAEFSSFFAPGLSEVLGEEYKKQKAMVKTANARKPLFWRVSR